jgi:DUF1009 family protein
MDLVRTVEQDVIGRMVAVGTDTILKRCAEIRDAKRMNDRDRTCPSRGRTQ